ncbi:AMP-binding protein [Mycobacterium sp.]|uniref:AMP-binding protein n=1 Tax=Mycobacterium sp. TaxID=1785 RepID=UPI003F967923
MTAATIVTSAARVVLRSGLFAPGGPLTMFRIVREAVRGGANLATVMAIAAVRWPDRAAVIDDDGALSYGQLQARAESLAAALVYRHGVGPGVPVGILCRNGRGFMRALFAAAAVGADVVLLNTEFRTDALATALGAHRIQTVVCDDEFADRVRAADEAVAVVDPAALEIDECQPRPKAGPRGRFVLLTSGTTGTPKGVPRTPSITPVLGVGPVFLDRIGLRAGSRIAVPVPMFHAFGFGMVLLTVILGGTLLTRRRFDAEATLAQASLHRAHALVAVPVMLARILGLSEEVRARNPVPSLRVVISAAARLDPSLAQRFMDTYGEILYSCYGSSEVGIGSFATPADLRKAPETVGRPVPGCPVAILDENARPVGPHVTGRVFVGGGLTFDSYTGGSRKDVVARMTDTGDMGYFDEAGRLFIVGRGDDMIVSGGENVYPRTVENALGEHPDVADHAVIGVPDEDFGQRLAAFVVPRPGAEIDETKLREYLKDRVSRFEQPRDITVVAEIPRNPTGKVLRKELDRDQPHRPTPRRAKRRKGHLP